MTMALSIVEVAASLFLIVTILLQNGTAQGLSGTIAGGAETFFGQNKARGIDAVLSKLTTIIAIIFVIVAIALNILPATVG